MIRECCYLLRKHNLIVSIIVLTTFSVFTVFFTLSDQFESLLHERHWYNHATYEVAYTTNLEVNQDAYHLFYTTFAIANNRTINADVLIVDENARYVDSPLLFDEYFNVLPSPIKNTAYMSANIFDDYELSLGDVISVHDVEFEITHKLPPGLGYDSRYNRNGTILVSNDVYLSERSPGFIVFIRDGLMIGPSSVSFISSRIELVYYHLTRLLVYLLSGITMFFFLSEWILDRKRVVLRIKALKRGGYTRSMIRNWIFLQMSYKYTLPSIVVIIVYNYNKLNLYRIIFNLGFLLVMSIYITIFFLYYRSKVYGRRKQIEFTEN